VIPLSIFAGLSVIVDRQAGAQRELLPAPVPRSYLGNLAVAVVLSALQAIVLVGLTAIRGGQVSHQRHGHRVGPRCRAAVHGFRSARCRAR
jgi:hypothetical protein